jgi:hypothetical protein
MIVYVYIIVTAINCSHSMTYHMTYPIIKYDRVPENPLKGTAVVSSFGVPRKSKEPRFFCSVRADRSRSPKPEVGPGPGTDGHGQKYRWEIGKHGGAGRGFREVFVICFLWVQLHFKDVPNVLNKRSSKRHKWISAGVRTCRDLQKAQRDEAHLRLLCPRISDIWLKHPETSSSTKHIDDGGSFPQFQWLLMYGIKRP